ncbi:hypothetical protein [Ottowia thiooxydans]|nr:hypothetical protein [Ottowia thiooxydans]
MNRVPSHAGALFPVCPHLLDIAYSGSRPEWWIDVDAVAFLLAQC